LLFHLLTRLEVRGLENIPVQGGFILCSNHLGIIDAPLVFAVVDRQDATALVANKYRHNLFLRPLINAVKGIWLNREEADAHALRAARHHLQQGGVLGIAPEGTRSKTGTIMQPKTGVAYLADKAGVPIIPMAIAGTEVAGRELRGLHRPRITVIIGQPFSLPPLGRENREAALQRNTDEIMCRIAALLPPKYWGVYAEHPRLKELLS
jgi:1-acyl-sn-glycerol-3-phosphate acyltransferase